ncbi:ATP-dependent nuclease [Kitasatospora sp. NPDC101447]|uniref:ATP-dependent nuclease n=1 Tax=Kitasatospora sp. NPDC101447 TaxID=3364102 RepID=UPI0037F28047
MKTQLGGGVVGIRFGLAELSLSDGTTVQPPLDGLTVFIGPNNSGKSLLLREIAARLSPIQAGQSFAALWLADAAIAAEGASGDLFDWLHQQGQVPRRFPGGHELAYPGPTQQPWSRSQVANSWESRLYGNIAHLLVAHLSTQDRLQSHHSNSQWWDPGFPPSHPLQYLADVRGAQDVFSRRVVAAFGQPVSIDRYDHTQLRLRVGEPGIPDEVPPPSPELRAAYQALPAVSEQGDGFQAFVNVLINTLVRPRPVILVDEPEAFLHPPQARLLGRFLAADTPSPCQVFVATHSSDFLAGLMDAGAAKPISLVRLSRTATYAQARSLQPEDVSGILKTPALRYSNIISGLFHDRVVLCEAEGDCQFYQASFDAIRGGKPHDNTVFLHLSGKARLADAAAKLRQCGIPVAVIADIDLRFPRRAEGCRRWPDGP